MAGSDGSIPTTDGGAVCLPAIEAVHPREIAEHVDVEPSTARAVLEALHAVDRERNPWRDPELLRRLYYREGLDQEAIADRLECGQTAVARTMRRHGIAPGSAALGDGARALLAADPDDLEARGGES